jgi:acyl-CoA dehydrogenase
MRDLFESTIERLFGDLISPALIHDASEGQWPAELWTALEELEITSALAPESLGGAGASWEDAYVLVRAAGAHAAPAPFPDTLLANWLLGRAGLAPLKGPTAIAASSALTYLNGQARGILERVPWGRNLKHVVAMTSGSDASIVVLETESASSIERNANLAEEPRDTLSFDKARVVYAVPVPEGLSAEALQLGGALLRSAQIAGALQTVLQMTATYATERVQFGKPIGQFQVIQQQIALMAEHTACCALAAEAAFAESDQDIAPLHTMTAKICAGEAASVGAAIAHAVHGAIGFTDEHSLHLKTRRLWAWRAEYGSQSFWSRRLGQRVCNSGSRALWPMLTQSSHLHGATAESLA